jgi:hypothetical protein
MSRITHLLIIKFGAFTIYFILIIDFPKEKTMAKKLTAQDLADKLYEKTRLKLEVDDDCLSMEVDRGPRTDHGGGEDGDDWLDYHQLEDLEKEYKEKHQTKINSLIVALKDLKVKGVVSFEYGEKGHCDIYVYWITL